MDQAKVNPYYLADYLRAGGGAIQIERLYKGATGLIERQPDEVDQILVDLLSGPDEQKVVSDKLREAERAFQKVQQGAETNLFDARAQFAKPAHLSVVKIA